MPITKKRKASFVGTEEWKTRDTGAERRPNGLVIVTDNPTGISVRSHTLGLEALYVDLAHRVKQLS